MSINAGSVSVEVVPDARLFAQKLRAKIGNLTAQVTANADTAKAAEQLDEVSRDRIAEIKARADTSQAERGISNLTAAIVGLSPALVPVTAAVGGLVASLTAPLAAAGGGLTLYGLLTGKTVADTEKLNKQIQQLDQKAAGLTDPKARKAVLAQRNALYKSLSDAQKNFIDQQAATKATFERFEGRLGDAILGPLIQGMKDLDEILPHTAPLLRTTSGALSTLLGDVDASVKSGSLAKFGGFIETWAGYSIVSFGRDLGNIGSGIAGIIQASAPLSGSVMDGLERMTGTFAKWGQNAGNNNFQDFLQYVHKVGPQAGRTLVDVAGAFGAIAKDAAPIGGAVLKGLDAFAKILHRIADSKAGPPLIEAAAGFVAVKKALQLGGALKGGLTSGVGRLTGLFKREGAAGAETIAGKALGKGVVPVYVTNKGFGGPGGGIGGAAEKDSKIGKALGGSGVAASLLPELGTLALPAAASAFVLTHPGPITHMSPHTRSVLNAAGARPGYQMPMGTQWHVANPDRAPHPNAPVIKPPTLAELKQAAQGQATLTNLLLAPAMKLGKVYASLPKQVKTEIATPGAVQSARDVQALKKQFDLTPKQVKTVMQLAGIEKAQAQLHAYTQMLADVNGKITKTFIQQVVRHPVAGGGHVAAYRSGMAAGGTVPGPRFPYGDKILMPVAPGEEIVPNYRGQADKWRPLLKAISSGGMAAGGTVGGSRGGVSLQQEIRGTLAIDRNGVAYIHGVARDAVSAGSAREQQASRTAALGVLQ